jgi:hypothetical protein
MMSCRGANTALASCGLPCHLTSRPRRPSRCLLIGPASRDETIERLEHQDILVSRQSGGRAHVLCVVRRIMAYSVVR